MRVYPKLDDAFAGVNVLKEYVKDGLELQLLHTISNKLNRTISTYKTIFPDLKEITLHYSMMECDLGIPLCNDVAFEKLISDITYISGLAEAHSVKINLLLHVQDKYDLVIARGLKSKLARLKEYLERFNILLLLENVIDVNGALDCKEHALEFVREMDAENIKCCLDICHIRCYLNKFNFDESILEEYLGTDLNRLVYQIHFADTWDNDGFKDFKTHAKYHSRKSFEHDINLLKRLNIDDKIIITEIVEFDNNYEHRECQLKELQLFR